MVSPKKRSKVTKVQNKHKLMVDSSALMALFDPNDSYHKEAVKFRENFILRYDVELYTTNYIFSETMSHLTHLKKDTLKILDSMINNTSHKNNFKIKQLWVNDKVVQAAMPIYYRYIEHDFSITDCTTFILMEQNNIFAAFSFDEDYKKYTYKKGYEKRGFWKLPEMLNAYIIEPKIIKFFS